MSHAIEFFQSQGLDLETAKRYADAEEAYQKTPNLLFEWEYSETTDADFQETGTPYQLWDCSIWDCDTGEMLEILCTVDFGPEGHPDSDPYARVVRAELMLEILSNDPTPKPSTAEREQLEAEHKLMFRTLETIASWNGAGEGVGREMEELARTALRSMAETKTKTKAKEVACKSE